MAGKENQKVWQKPAPGTLYLEIATANGLRPLMTPMVGRHLRVVQSNISDARCRKDLSVKARWTQQRQKFTDWMDQ